MAEVKNSSYTLGHSVIHKITYNHGVISNIYRNWQELKDFESFWGLETKDDYLELTDNESHTQETWYEIKKIGGVVFYAPQSKIGNFHQILLNFN